MVRKPTAGNSGRGGEKFVNDRLATLSALRKMTRGKMGKAKLQPNGLERQDPAALISRSLR